MREAESIFTTMRVLLSSLEREARDWALDERGSRTAAMTVW